MFEILQLSLTQDVHSRYHQPSAMCVVNSNITTY